MDDSKLQSLDWEGLGRRIKIALEGNRVVEIAEKIGIAKTNIYKWIKGEKHPSLENIFSFSFALSRRVSVQWLLTEEGPKWIENGNDIANSIPDSGSIVYSSEDVYGCELLRGLHPDAKAAAIIMMEVLSKQATNNPQLDDEKIYTYDDLIEMLEGLRDKTTSQVKLKFINQVIEMVQRKFGGKSKGMNSR